MDSEDGENITQLVIETLTIWELSTETILLLNVTDALVWNEQTVGDEQALGDAG